VTITIEPDIAASTPASPVFDEPIHILDIRQVKFVKQKSPFEIKFREVR
jgi:hypothetical protein